ncbi:TetR/AcrR family transcriptional regulator [Zooshikella harenae]|uniref:TetR/AcrR family transcriptional regulator n=1 Tax=Zooshikella harenae TaxID=2827238 RepID=A0ABS5ZBT6_9GAMM|nr:TetR/AcrR family transcriptional regulator [Zooshikella harenae]MBU2711521.1 TetR/AcrR family transcriptional regulator [Zooshikella harenae]
MDNANNIAKRKQGRPPKSPEEQAAIRNRIIDVAKELFLNDGFEQVSVRKIAAKVGCTPRTLYYYFENKRSLLHFIWIDIFAQLADYADEHIPSNLSPKEIIKASLQAYVSYWLEHPDRFRVIFSIEDLNSTPDQDQDASRIVLESRFFQRLFKAVEACCQQNMFTEDNHELVGHMLMCSVQGIVNNVLTIKQIPWSPVDQLLNLQLEGLLSGLAQH